MCRSFHRALSRLKYRIGSVHHRPPGIYPCFRVFTGETLRPSPRSAAASRWSCGRRAATTTPEPDGFLHRGAERGARLRGCGAAGCRGSVLGGSVPGMGCSRCPLDLQRQRYCCNLTAPPLTTAPANHSPAGEPNRAPIGRQACQSPEALSAT